MKRLADILSSSKIVNLPTNNVSNVNNSKYNKLNNVNNVNNDNNRYSLDKSKFTPNTEETILAEEIAKFFNDLNNYAGYLEFVNTVHCSEAIRFFKEVKTDIENKKNTKYPVRNPAGYFFWKYKLFLKPKCQVKRIDNPTGERTMDPKHI